MDATRCAALKSRRLFDGIPVAQPMRVGPFRALTSWRRLSAGLGRILLVAATAAMAATAAGCGDDNSRNPAGPGAMQGPAAGNPGMGNAGGGMAVNSEFDYLAEMIPHHEEAIDAARVLARGTRRETLRRFAETIIDTQSAEVQQMRRWLAAWYPGRGTSVAYQPMMRDLRALTGDALDRAFLDDMIPHHRMAVMMSQQLIARGLAQHAEVVPFAGTIRDVQQQEVQMMVLWLAEWFGAPPPMGH
jgi:uncharacterized protein (DUF305 family)